MKPEVEKGDIVNLVPYHFYKRVATEDSEDAFSGQTVPLDVEESKETAKVVVAHSRKRYATSKTKMAEYMAELFKEPVVRRVTTNRKPN